MCSAVVDTTEKGTLNECQLLKPFKESGQFSKFGEIGEQGPHRVCTCKLTLDNHLDQVNYSISVYEEGNVLCIVTTGGTVDS